MAIDEQIIGSLNQYAGNANVQVGGNQPFVMNIPQEAHNKLLEATDNYVKEKKQEKAQWEENVASKIQSISKMDGVLAKDIPKLAEEKKKVIQYIKENAYLLSPANQMKNPEKYSELESMVTDYISKVDKSKADNVIYKEYVTATKKPEYSNPLMEKRLQKFLDTENIMDREPISISADPKSILSKNISDLYTKSATNQTISETMLQDGAMVRYQDVYDVDPDKFVQLIQGTYPETFDYEKNTYNEVLSDEDKAKLAEEGINDADDYAKSQIKRLLPANNQYLGTSKTYTNPKYTQEQQTKRAEMSNETKLTIAEQRNKTQKEIADARLAYLKEKQSIQGNGNFDKINQVFSAVDKLAELGQEEKASNGETIYKISPNDVDSNIQSALYAGGQSAHGDAYGIVYRSTLPNGAIVYRPAKVQYIDKRSGKEAKKEQYKNNPAAYTTSVVPDMNDGNAFTEEQLINRLATREQGTRIQYDKWLQMNGKQTTQTSGSQPSATSGALTNENILGSINKIKGSKYEMGAKGEGGKYDCSGFVCKVLNENGINFNGSSEELITKAPTIVPSVSQAQVGDVIGIDSGLTRHEQADGRDTPIDHTGIVIEKNGKLYFAELTKSGYFETPLKEKTDKIIDSGKELWIGRYDGEPLKTPRELNWKGKKKPVSSQSTAKPKQNRPSLDDLTKVK
jgi:cell wall-associated NlpC family hydrolase